jgi:hypothetical protein
MQERRSARALQVTSRDHHITGHLVFVLVSTEWVTLCPAVDYPASCEIRAVNHFLRAKTWALLKSIVNYSRYHKDGDKILNQIVRVTGDKTWVSFANVESKAVDAYTFTKLVQKAKTNVSCQKADGNCFLGQERSVDSRINATRDHKGPPLWSSGQNFWLHIQRSRVRFPALLYFLRSGGSGTRSTQPREDNWEATWMKK